MILMEVNEIKDFLRLKSGYLKEGSKRLKNHLYNKGYNTTLRDCKTALRDCRRELMVKDLDVKSSNDVFAEAFLNNVKIKEELPRVIRVKNKKNVLIIGDLHLPFSLNGYLEHCIDTYKKYNCNEVIFIGDIIDNHASSYHETNPDGSNAGQELAKAIKDVSKWYKAFPKASIIIGNHDRIIMRKAYSSGLSRHWIKDYNEVLNTPDWNFIESIEIDNVKYIHGEGGTARSRVKGDLQSIVQGHLHTQCYIEWFVGNKFKLFSMQVGCGIDHKSYAMAYAKENKKPAIACGVVLDGTTAINIMMNL